MTILANDGLSQAGISALKNSGFDVLTVNVAQEQLTNFLNEQKVDALLVRSATKVDRNILDNCPNLKLIGRGGVGLDNIDVAYAKSKGVPVINTPEASSISVAELVFAHLYGAVRYVYDANRNMPLEGDSKFKSLKKSYAKGMELKGKTLGIIGFGRIGQETAKIGIGVGMRIIYHDPQVAEIDLNLSFFNGDNLIFHLNSVSKETVLKEADFISLHIPGQTEYLLGKEEFDQMKNGVGIINTARGGVLDEVALVEALDSGKVSFAGLDVFESEPNPEIRILMHPKISLTPHIGAATIEAQNRIGLELAAQVISLLK